MVDIVHEERLRRNAKEKTRRVTEPGRSAWTQTVALLSDLGL